MMNLLVKFKYPIRNSTVFVGVESIYFYLKLSIHQKTLPPLTKKSKRSDSYELKPEANLPIKFDRIQRDIFGATILPQNLSFENSKKLTENQVKLEDIPIVDENAVAENMILGKLKEKRCNSPEVGKNQNNEDDSGVIIINTALTKQHKPTSNSPGKLFSALDSYEEIPGPKIFRTFLNAVKNFTRQLTVASLFQFLKKNASATFRVYGPIIRLPEILGGKIVLISRPEHVSGVLDQDRRYPVNSTLDSIQRARLLQYGKNASKDFLLSEEEWENVRNSNSNPPVKELENYFEEIDEASTRFLRRVKVIRNKHNEVPDDFLFEINKWSLECLCRVIFDKTSGFLEYEQDCSPSKSSQLLYSLTVATKALCTLETGFQLWRFINTSSLSSLSSACSILENIISENVTEARLYLIKRKKNLSDNNVEKLSLVEGLLLQSDSTPDDVVTNILDTLLIGTNTMSVALGFLFYHISRNPRCQTELWKEIKTVLPEKYSRLEYEQLPSLKYLSACLKESLRLKMPMPILARVLSNNVVLGNYHIPKGTFVLMAAQVENMKEENFSDPMQFFPERWFHQESETPFPLLPRKKYFRGNSEKLLAEIAIRVCASHIIRHFLIEYYYEEIQATNTTISFPNKPLKFTFIERKD